MTEGIRIWYLTLFRCMVLTATLLPVLGSAEESCNSGVVFGFFNGVQTTEQLAKYVAYRQLIDLYGDATPEGDQITYDLFYNDTQGFADFVETFDQRLQEHGSVLAGRFELFFSATRGEGSWWTALTSAIPNLVGLLDDLFNLSRSALMSEMTKALGTPNMGEVSARHREQIDKWAMQQKKMLFFAHSQGNLFVNRAYAHAVSKTEASGVKVVHVGPASPTLSGPYTLADKDLVINALRLVGSVEANTTEIPAYLGRPAGLNGQRDLMGHGLLEIYINPALDTSRRVREHVSAALKELDSIPPAPPLPFPEFVPASWEGGDSPKRVYAPHDATHRLDKVTYESSFTESVMKGANGEWYWNEVHYPKQYAVTWRFFGPGMDGFDRCEWQEMIDEGWYEPFQVYDCTYERRPVQGHPIKYSLFESDEFKAVKNAPLGTVLSLSKLTFTDPALLNMGEHSREIQFKSGRESNWWWDFVWPYSFWEPYVFYKYGAWLNEAEVRAWEDAYNAHRKAEAQRYDRYIADKKAHDEKCSSLKKIVT